VKLRASLCALMLVSAYGFATPDRTISVVDDLIGFHNDNYVIRQTVWDNEGSHYSSHVEVYLVEKAIKTSLVISIDRITLIRYSDEKAVGRSEDRIKDIIQQRPYLFYELEYPLPLGTLTNGKDSIYLKGSTIEYMSEGRGKTIDLWKWLPSELKGNEVTRIVQTYSYGAYYFFLIELERNHFYQKIVPIPLAEFNTQE
jgi:hypothetical protein